jgi:hypothetical protein
MRATISTRAGTIFQKFSKIFSRDGTRLRAAHRAHDALRASSHGARVRAAHKKCVMHGDGQAAPRAHQRPRPR